MNGPAPAPASLAPAKRVFLPREHGAYGQLLFPLGTALALGNGSPSALTLAFACASAFVAHEGLLVLLGQRGRRAARDWTRQAAIWSAGCGMLAALAALVAIVRMPAAARAWLLLPAALSILVLLFVVRGREHSALGEAVAAVALSSCGVPVALAGGVPAARAITCWLVFALAFTVATIAVQSVIARVKAAHRRLSPPLIGRAAAWFAAGALAVSLLGGVTGWWPWAVPAALVPVCGLAEIVSLFPPHPRHLRSVGWSLVSATAATAVVLTVAFR